VISLTARPREPTSSRTVIEYEMLGAIATLLPPSLALLWGHRSPCGNLTRP
jgi:hypothetical protein